MRDMVRRGWLVGGWLLMVVARTAHAETPAAPPGVTVVVSGDAPWQSAMQKAVSELRRSTVTLDLVAAPNRAHEAQGQAARHRLDGRLVEARAAYVDAEFERCLGQLPESSDLTELLAAGGFEPVARAMVLRVGCELGRGHTQEARAQAEALAALGLSLSDTGQLVTPEAERLLSEAALAQDRAPRTRLTVQSRPGARVLSIDGHLESCVTPCGVELGSGEHVLQLRGEGTVPLTTRVRVDAQPGEQWFELSPAPPALCAEQWSARYAAASDRDGAASLRLLSCALSSRRLVLLWTEPASGERSIIRGSYAEGGSLRARARSPELSLEQLAQGTSRLVDDLLMRGGVLPEPRPVWKSPWLWVSVGVVAAATAVTTALLVRSPQSRTEVSFQ